MATPATIGGSIIGSSTRLSINFNNRLSFLANSNANGVPIITTIIMLIMLVTIDN